MDETSIRQFMESWHRATTAEDREKLRSLMAEDAVFLAARQPPMIGWAGFVASFDQAVEKYRITPSGTVRDVLFSGDLACCWTDLTVKISPRDGGEPTVRSGPTLTILRRVAQGWVLVRDANLLS